MKDIKTLIIGFLLATCMFLIMGQSKNTQNGRYQIVEGASVHNGATGTFDIPTAFQAMDLGPPIGITINVTASQTITVKGGIITNIA